MGTRVWQRKWAEQSGGEIQEVWAKSSRVPTVQERILQSSHSNSEGHPNSFSRQLMDPNKRPVHKWQGVTGHSTHYPQYSVIHRSRIFFVLRIPMELYRGTAKSKRYYSWIGFGAQKSSFSLPVPTEGCVTMPRGWVCPEIVAGTSIQLKSLTVSGHISLVAL